MTPNILSSREADRRLYLQHLVDVTDEIEIEMKVPKGTYAPMKEGAQSELDAYDARDKTRTTAETASKELKTQAKKSGLIVRGTVKEIKNTVGVPASVLKLVQSKTTTGKPQNSVKAEVPLLKPKMKGIQPIVTGAMYGYDALELWCCRANETEHTLLETITHLPYYDTRPNVVPDQPENRSYFGRYMKRNVVVSSQGPTVDLTVPGGPHQ